MRICPECGWPKEVHDKREDWSPARLPKHAPGRGRTCLLVMADPEQEIADGEPIRMAPDVGQYRRRLAIYDEERALRFDD